MTAADHGLDGLRSERHRAFVARVLSTPAAVRMDAARRASGFQSYEFDVDDDGHVTARIVRAADRGEGAA